MHPFLIHGGDIGFTSTQRSSYDDACATYPISGTAQESDFSLSLHRLHRLLFSAFSTSRAPTVHLGSNARKRPVKRSRLDRTRLDSTRLDSKSTRLSTLGERAGAAPSLSDIYEKRIMNFPAANRRKHEQLCSVTPDCQLQTRSLLFRLYVPCSSLPLRKLPSVSSRGQLSLLLIFLLYFSLFLFLPHACLAKPTGHRCSKPLYLTRNGPSYTRAAHLSILLLVCIATTRVYFFLVGSLALW